MKYFETKNFLVLTEIGLICAKDKNKIFNSLFCWWFFCFYFYNKSHAILFNTKADWERFEKYLHDETRY
jgi:hypothetical protein